MPNNINKLKRRRSLTDTVGVNNANIQYLSRARNEQAAIDSVARQQYKDARNAILQQNDSILNNRFFDLNRANGVNNANIWSGAITGLGTNVATPIESEALRRARQYYYNYGINYVERY